MLRVPREQRQARQGISRFSRHQEKTVLIILCWIASKYEHPGAPLSGAYCVEMLRQRNRAKYDRDIQYRVCKFLRHEISKTSGLTIWPDGFVNLKDLFEIGGIRRFSDPNDLSAWFRTSYMHTQLDDGGVRFKIVYLASKKQWHLPVGSAKFQAVSASRYCTD